MNGIGKMSLDVKILVIRDNTFLVTYYNFFRVNKG